MFTIGTFFYTLQSFQGLIFADISLSLNSLIQSNSFTVSIVFFPAPFLYTLVSIIAVSFIGCVSQVEFFWTLVIFRVVLYFTCVIQLCSDWFRLMVDGAMTCLRLKIRSCFTVCRVCWTVAHTRCIYCNRRQDNHRPNLLCCCEIQGLWQGSEVLKHQQYTADLPEEPHSATQTHTHTIIYTCHGSAVSESVRESHSSYAASWFYNSCQHGTVVNIAHKRTVGLRGTQTTFECAVHRL